MWIYTGDGQGHFTHTFSIAAGDQPTGLNVVPTPTPASSTLLVGDPFGDVLRLQGNGDGTFQPPTGNRGLWPSVQPAASSRCCSPTRRRTTSWSRPSPDGDTFAPRRRSPTPPPRRRSLPATPSGIRSTRTAPPRCGRRWQWQQQLADLPLRPGHGTLRADQRHPGGRRPGERHHRHLTGRKRPRHVRGQQRLQRRFRHPRLHRQRSMGGQAGPRLKSGGFGPSPPPGPDAGSPGGNDLAISTRTGRRPFCPAAVRDSSTTPIRKGSRCPPRPFRFPRRSRQARAAITSGGGLLRSTRTIWRPARPSPFRRRTPWWRRRSFPAAEVVAAEEDGTVEAPSRGGRPVPAGGDFGARRRGPEAPSALQVLETAHGEEVLVTTRGLDKVFVFTVFSPAPPTPPEPNPPTPPQPIPPTPPEPNPPTPPQPNPPTPPQPNPPGTPGQNPSTTPSQNPPSPLDATTPGFTFNVTSPAGAEFVLVLLPVAQTYVGESSGPGTGQAVGVADNHIGAVAAAEPQGRVSVSRGRGRRSRARTGTMRTSRAPPRPGRPPGPRPR